MSNYSTLKAAISAVIKENNNHEITGQVLQTTLLAMVDSLAGGYLFKGIATPATVVGTPDENVFYIGGGGLYSNFGATPVHVPDGCIGIFTYNGSFENHIIPTGGVFDISAYNAVGGTPATYADLTAALGTNGANIPDYLRKGGMSVKFIQGSAPSSDNNSIHKYVQYRLMADSFSTTESDWQGVDDKPTPESHNFVESDGVYNFAIPMTNAACIRDIAISGNSDQLLQIVVFRNWFNTSNSKYRSGVSVQYGDSENALWVNDYIENSSKETTDSSIMSGYHSLTTNTGITKPFTLQLIIDYSKIKDETLVSITEFNFDVKYGINGLSNNIVPSGVRNDNVQTDNLKLNRYLKEIYLFDRTIDFANKNVLFLILKSLPINSKYRSGIYLVIERNITLNMYYDFDTQADAEDYLNKSVCYHNLGMFVIANSSELSGGMNIFCKTTGYINDLDFLPIISNYINSISINSRKSDFNFVSKKIPKLAITIDGAIDYYNEVDGIYIVKVDSKQYSRLIVKSSKALYYIGWYSDLPSASCFIKREYQVSEAIIPIGAKYVAIQFNDSVIDGDYIRVLQDSQFVNNERLCYQNPVIQSISDSSTFIDGLVGISGNIIPNSDSYWAHTHKISCHYGQKIKSWTKSGSTAHPWAVFFDENDNVLGAIIFPRPAVNYNEVFEGLVPLNAASVIINTFKPIEGSEYVAIIDLSLKGVGFANKKIAFAGDSITYGYDDDNTNNSPLKNTWVEQVGVILDAGMTKNYGVSSASVMPVTGTPFALSTQYTSFSDDIDLLGVMIGINDAFRAISLHNPDYVLGTMSDRTTETFYGALHVMWSGLLAKYPPKNGKKLFMIAYFGYSGLPQADWDLWDNAQREVAEYYSIPICDLKKNLGINQRTDINHEYWKNGSAHPTQLGANVIGKYIANWVKKNFEV